MRDDRRVNFFYLFLLFVAVSAGTNSLGQQSELVHRITFLIGNRRGSELNQLLASLDFGKLNPDEKGSVVVAYSELFSWGGFGYEYSERAYYLAERALKEHPEHWKSHYAMAVVLAHRVQKNNLLALTLIGRIDHHLSLSLKYGPDRWEPHYLAGVRYAEVPIFPDLRRAEELLLKALELEANHVFTYLVLGKIHEKRGDFCKALELYQRGLSRGVRAEWRVVDEDARSEIEKRIPEVSRKCTKR